MSFSRDIGKHKDRAIGRIGRIKRGVAIKLFNSVVQDTPVLTGRLRGNWRVSIGEPDYTTSETDIDKSGQLVSQLITRTTQQAEGDDSIHFTNSLPYARRIEYEGHSSQKAPSGMVRKNFTRVQNLLEQQLRGTDIGL